jgi:hypothetical protein
MKELSVAIDFQQYFPVFMQKFLPRKKFFQKNSGKFSAAAAAEKDIDLHL